MVTTFKKIEIPFVGHATIATLCELARLNLYGLGRVGKNEVHMETLMGNLTMWTEVDYNGKVWAIMEGPEIRFVDYHLQRSKFAQTFGIPSDVITSGKKILLDVGLNYVYAPIVSLEALGSLKFDFARVKKMLKGEKTVLFCFYTPQAFDNDSALHSRVIAPLIGFTEEDYFTGSTQAAVCSAARNQGLLDNTKTDYKVEQGDFAGRSGRARVIFDKSHKTPLVIATAAHVFSTEISF